MLAVIWKPSFRKNNRMGKTYRKEPSNQMNHKQQKHIGYKRLEEEAEQYLHDIPHKKPNRIKSALNRIPDPWDDQIVSEFRGQDWYRNRND
jgi:hypothetical protein